jgi:signal transduction histidine kinase
MTTSCHTQDRTADVLSFAQRLLCTTVDAPTGTNSLGTAASADNALKTLLEELAGAFGAQGAGVIAPLEGPRLFRQESWLSGTEPASLVYPWEIDAGVLAAASRASATAEPGIEVAEGGAVWLVAEVALPGYASLVIWVMDGAPRAWSDGERAALPIAGQAVARLQQRAGASWLRCLENVRVQKAVEQAVRVACRLAHDFGNYLTGILGFTELATKQVAEDSLPQLYLKEAWHSAKEGADWVHKLHNLRQNRRPHLGPTDLASVVRKEESRLQPQCAGGVLLTISLEGRVPLIDIDKEALRQVVAQLLDNAREAIPERGAITLSARATHLDATACHGILGSPRPGAFVEITVTDSGVGLPAEMRARPFADFFFSTKPRHRGLGLVTVFWLVQVHQGGICFGPHPEPGTTVRVFLPVAQGERAVSR